MNKEAIYQQIKNFKQSLADKYRKDIKDIDDKRGFYYVDDANAKDKASFIGYLIINNYLDPHYSKILDLTFGSGNLTSHIILDNDIGYDHIFLNDLHLNEANQYIPLDNCDTKDINILGDTQDNLYSHIFSGEEADLIIVNPQFGGNYDEGNLLKQKEKQKDETDQDIYERLAGTLLKFINHGKTLVFYEGRDGNFKNIFHNYVSNYIHYKSKLNDVYVIGPKIDKAQCFEKHNDQFIPCKKETKEEEILSFDDIEQDFKFLDNDKQNNKDSQKEVIVMQDTKKYIFTDTPLGNLNYPYKNILFKGVPGTGKSTTINQIIKDKLELDPFKDNDNILRINIHSASSNADLMQGIGITTTNGQVAYKEKQGLIYEHIRKACYAPRQAFALVLEEIQENSLNELIGDLIYLIEIDKRANIQNITLSGEYTYQKLIANYIQESEKEKQSITYVEIPNLVEESIEYRKMIIPDNLYIFCTSNYRDDKKIIEDNLLRRFEVYELYPSYEKNIYADKHVSKYLDTLNSSILNAFKAEEIHPDRFQIGHANWLNIQENKSNLYYQALLKVIIEFKEIKEIEFEKLWNILATLQLEKENNWVRTLHQDLIQEIDDKEKNYKTLIDALQLKAYSDLF